MPGIQKTSRRAIETILDCELVDLDDTADLHRALMEANASPVITRAAATAETVFSSLTDDPERAGADFRKFINGWQATHVTALYVSGLIIRLQREAHEAALDGESMKAELLHEAAFHMGEIIAEDTGAVGKQHGAMFEEFANALTGGDDSWKTGPNRIPECDEFRSYVEYARLRAPIEDAILTTMASEVWNTGEYTHAAPLTRQLMEDRGVDRPAAANGYVAVHAGDTELNHFTHALKAWQLYCAAEGIEADPKKAASVMIRYAEKLEPAFAALSASLEAAPALSASVANHVQNSPDRLNRPSPSF